MGQRFSVGQATTQQENVTPIFARARMITTCHLEDVEEPVEDSQKVAPKVVVAKITHELQSVQPENSSGES